MTVCPVIDRRLILKADSHTYMRKSVTRSLNYVLNSSHRAEIPVVPMADSRFIPHIQSCLVEKYSIIGTTTLDQIVLIGRLIRSYMGNPAILIERLFQLLQARDDFVDVRSVSGVFF